MFITGPEEIEAISKVFASGNFMRYRGGEGGFTEQFEAKIQKDMNVAHALALNSGTNALICALVGLDLKHGDEVIVPTYTWVASAMAALMAGAIPVLADIDASLCLDPEDFERKITPKTRAVIPVHIQNRLCDLKKIKAIAAKHHVAVVEDACQAVGLSYDDGQFSGTVGDAGAFSFNVFKNIMCGEGGMLLTNNRRIYERGLMFHDAGCYTRDHASSITEPFFPGFNFRVSEVQGAILFEQYKRLPGILAKLKARKTIAREVLAKAAGFTIAPENDGGTMTVALRFEDSERAKAFAGEFKSLRTLDSGRHVFANWEPVLKRAYYSDELNPYRFATHEISYDPAGYQASLDTLAHTVVVANGFNLSETEYRDCCMKMCKF